MSDPLRRLSDAGVAVWLDDISRDRLQSGNLADLVARRSVVGVTSNPTIFQAAVTKSSAYDEQLAELAARGASTEQAVRAITTDDVRAACDVLAPVVQATGGLDGRVSIEVDPRLAQDAEATLRQARELWQLVDRPNLYIKIPATEAGLPAIRAALAEGISVNVTLIFSVERYRAVLDAWMSGLEDRARQRETGGNLDGVLSVASFFVSRVDTEIDKRLDRIGTPEALALRGRAAVANARLAFAAYEEVMASPRWAELASQGARPQRPLWASTGTKNPDYPDTLYVDELVVAGVVNTMPEATLEAFADHGRVEPAGGQGLDTVRPYAPEARALFGLLEAAGVDLADVFITLEEEGLEKFETSWNDLLTAVEAKLEAHRAGRSGEPGDTPR